MQTIEFLGLNFYPYGLAAAGAAALALLMAVLLARSDAKLQTALSWFAVLAIPTGTVMARLGYCLASFDWWIAEGFDFLLRITDGGLMLYGAMLGCVLAAIIAARLSGVKAAQLLDHLAAPAMLMIALCRLAECLVGVGFGWCVEDWFMEDSGMSLLVLEDPSFFCRFPFAVRDFYGAWNWAVFVPEAVAALVIMALVLRCHRPTGARTTLALTLYAALQVLFESGRQDSVLRWGFVRVNQIIGAVLLAALLTLCIIRSGERRWRQILPRPVMLLAGILIVIAMEFALEGKISAIEWMTMDVCYMLMSGAVALMIAAIIPVWREAFLAEVNT